MKNIQNIFRPLVLLLVLAIACAPRVHRPAIDKDKRTEAEHRFNPVGFPGDDAVITGQRGESAQTPSSETAGTEIQTIGYPDNDGDDNYAVEQSQPLVVFRVQVFASKSFDEAHRFAGDIEGMFPEGVFVEYQIPYYKVRVGEFYTPEEGESFLDRVKQVGFKNAWLVRVVQ